MCDQFCLFQFLIRLYPEFESLRGQLFHLSPLPTLDDTLKNLMAENTRLRTLLLVLLALHYLLLLPLHLLLCGSPDLHYVLLAPLVSVTLLVPGRTRSIFSATIATTRIIPYRNIGRRSELICCTALSYPGAPSQF